MAWDVHRRILKALLGGLVSLCLTDHNLDAGSLNFLQNHHVPGSALETQKNYFSQQPREEAPL